MKKPASGVLTAVAVAAGSVLLSAPAAHADLTTRCVGEGGAVTVPGDLVVPAGQSCTLAGTTVTGDVRVRAGADLIAEDTSISGRLVLAADAYAETVGSNIDGDVVLAGGFGVVVEQSSVGGRVLSRAAGEVEAGFVFVLEADLRGDVVARSGEVYVEDSEVAGSLRSNGVRYADLYQTFVDGDLTVRNTQDGSIICGAAIQGTARLVGNAELVQIGSDGPSAECTSPSYFGADLLVRENTGGTVIDSGIVNGSVRLSGNSPEAQIGAHLMVRGEIVGPHSPWETSPATRSTLSAERDRGAGLRLRIEDRHAEATQSAGMAGDADLG